MPAIRLPLEGQTVLNLRAQEDAPALTRALRALGAAVVERPVLAFAAPSNWAPFDVRAAKFVPGDWIAFTSATAVRCALSRLAETGREVASLAQANIAALGKGTAKAVTEAGLPVRLIPSAHFQSEGLLEALLAVLAPGEAVWVPRAEQGREVLVESLERAGHPVALTPVYRTVTPPEGLGAVPDLLDRAAVDWIVFTSASTVTNFLDLLPTGMGNWQDRVRIACLGRVTEEMARQRGLIVAVRPEQQDLDGLVAAMARVAMSTPAGET